MAEQADLTRREREVLDLLRLGLTNEEIAGRLGITLDGAKYHVSQIISKLRVRDRYEAASWAERRPGSTAALAPLAALWNRATGVLPVKLSRLASVVSAGVLAATIGVLALIIVLFARTETEPAVEAVRPPAATSAQDGVDGRRPSVSLLLGENRTVLSLCVDGVGEAAISDSDVETVDGELAQALADAAPIPADFADAVVSRGCPAPSGLTGTPVNPGEPVYGVGAAHPSTPNEHRVFVYYVTPEEYTSTFGTAPYGIAIEEMMCQGHLCGGVTDGLYLPPTAGSEDLRRGLLEVLGLLQVDEGISLPDQEAWRSCELGTPESWCVNYDLYLEEVADGTTP